MRTVLVAEKPVSSEEIWKVAAAGQPAEEKTIMSGDVVEVWQYEVAPKIYLKVRFNRSDRVINTQLDSEYKTGG